MADFDPVLAHKSSTVNLASNPATFFDVFSVSFTFRFGQGATNMKKNDMGSIKKFQALVLDLPTST